MIHPPVDEVLLPSVALRGLIVVPGLLLLRSLPLSAGIVLSRSVLRIIGAMARIVTMSTTPETHGGPSRGCVVVPHGSTDRSVLTVLLGVEALRRLLILLILLNLARVLILVLPKVGILSSWANLISLWGSKARARVARLAL